LRAPSAVVSRRVAAAGLLALGAGPAHARAAGSRLYFLSGSKVLTARLDGSEVRTLVSGRAGGLNDGIAFEPVGRRLFWTNMGRASADDGFIQSAKLDGSDLRMVVPPGGTFTPKQLKIAGGKLYWSDREGMRVMRANLDGSGIEVLVQTGAGEADRKDPSRWCVGIAVDLVRGHVYWTQKGGDNAGQGSIRRAGLDLPAGATPSSRKDVEVLFANLPEPIDLEIEPARRRLYWTDRGDNTVSSAPLDRPRGADPARRGDRRILLRGVGEAIGLAFDLASRRMFYTSLGGELGSAGLDGETPKRLLEGQGVLTGVVLAP
jgi:hypothetical protein